MCQLILDQNVGFNHLEMFRITFSKYFVQIYVEMLYNISLPENGNQTLLVCGRLIIAFFQFHHHPPSWPNSTALGKPHVLAGLMDWSEPILASSTGSIVNIFSTRITHWWKAITGGHIVKRAGVLTGYWNPHPIQWQIYLRTTNIGTASNCINVYLQCKFCPN